MCFANGRSHPPRRPPRVRGGGAASRQALPAALPGPSFSSHRGFSPRCFNRPSAAQLPPRTAGMAMGPRVSVSSRPAGRLFARGRAGFPWGRLYVRVRVFVPTPVPLAAARRYPRSAKGFRRVGAASKPGRARCGPVARDMMVAGRGGEGRGHRVCFSGRCDNLLQMWPRALGLQPRERRVARLCPRRGAWGRHRVSAAWREGPRGRR